MEEKNTDMPISELIYAFILSFYPEEHKKQYSSLMLQTFRDYYNDVQKTQGNVGISFWLDVIIDEIKSIVSEQLAAMKGDNLAMNKYALGLVLGLVMSVAVVLTNIVFPGQESDSEYGALYLVTYLGLFFLFGVGGYLASKRTNGLLSGAVGGAITAFLSISLTMLTFIIIDNLFLDIVSQQPDKIWGFQHQQTFNSMRDYVNSGLLRGVIIALPAITLFGALFGAIGAGIRKLSYSLASHSL